MFTFSGPARTPPLDRGRRRGFIVTAGAIVLLSLALWLAACTRAEPLPVWGAVPAFALTDQQGQIVRDTDLAGKVWVAGFIYTKCTDICPGLTRRMAALQSELQRQGLLGGQVELVSITVDPERDTPEVLADYAAAFGADPANWRFLTGDPEAVRHLVVRGFLLGAEVVYPPAADQGEGDGHQHGSHADGETQAGGQGDVSGEAGAVPYEVMHSGRFALVDAQGQIRAYWRADEIEVATMVQEIKQVLKR